MERVAAIDFFAVRTELLTQRRESRGGGRGAHCRGGPIDHNDVTLKFGGAGDGEVQGKAVVVWRGEGRKRTGEQGRACRALRGDAVRARPCPDAFAFSREVLVCRSWSQSVSRHGRARARRFAVGYLSRELIPREFVSINNSTVIA